MELNLSFSDSKQSHCEVVMKCKGRENRFLSILVNSDFIPFLWTDHYYMKRPKLFIDLLLFVTGYAGTSW